MNKVENELLYLGYSRYVSRSHTIISLIFEGILTILFGTIGIIVSLVEVGIIPDFNEYFLSKTILYLGVTLFIFAGIMLTFWWHTKLMRKRIVSRIKELNT
jgi:ABC-type multidrug transport system permease subunit